MYNAEYLRHSIKNKYKKKKTVTDSINKYLLKY